MRVLLAVFLLIAVSVPAAAQDVAFGVRIRDLTPERAAELNTQVTGAEVIEIKPGSIADKAGFRPDDVIMVFASTAITGAQHLADQIRVAADQGGDHPIQYWRAGQIDSISVSFGPCLHGASESGPNLPADSPFVGLFPDMVTCNPAPVQ